MSRATTKEFFIKERLTEVREARGLTQTGLAKSLLKSPSTISNWERGEQAPEPAALEQLAGLMDVPTAYFRQPMPEYGDGAIFFRSLSNATARVRTKEKARVRWLQHISLTLQRTLDFPDIRFPQLLADGDYKSLDHADLEKLAEAMRKHWNLGEAPIKNVILVAENAGTVVGVDSVGSTKIDGQGNWCRADNRPYILLAGDKYTAFRRQMDLSHELCHLILHRGVSEAELAENFHLIEDQAKYLACAFLLPHRSFSADVFSLSLDGLMALKPKWMVSVGAMIKRAHQLEMLSDGAAQRLWQYRATRGWHKREPLDLPSETPVEEPRLLKRSVEMIVQAKVRSKTDLLSSDICLAGHDVEQLACLSPHYFADPATVVHFEPKLKARDGVGGTGEVIPMRKPN
jgi:Zn-dependent peptidase ImmA (M78 family)/transcriptional regulator with XRE-family HTH domain